MFKFFEKIFNDQHAKYMVNFYHIAGALTNQFYFTIHKKGARVELTQEILLRILTPNVDFRDITDFIVLD